MEPVVLGYHKKIFYLNTSKRELEHLSLVS